MTHERIEINPAIMFGKSVTKGTRITVEHILRELAGEMTIDEILSGHPHLTRDDVHVAAAFAADYLAQEDIVFADGQCLRSFWLMNAAMLDSWTRCATMGMTFYILLSRSAAKPTMCF